MKKIALILIAAIVNMHALQSQNQPIVPKKMYQLSLEPNNGEKKKTRMLFELKDSAILISNSFQREDYTKGFYKLSKVDVKNIDVLRLKRKGSGAAIAIGGASGMILGAILSVSYNNSLKKNMNPLEYAFGGGIQAVIPFLVSTAIGFGAGIAFGLSRVTFHLNGSQEKYETVRNEMNDYAVHPVDIIKNARVAGSFSILKDSVIDLDNNVYHTLALAGQVWMADNRGLCPKGWHVPSMPEWESMVACLGGADSAVIKLTDLVTKYAGNDKQSYIAGHVFAVPGGFRFSTGEFSPNKTASYQWWSSTPQDPGTAKSIQLGNTENGIFFSGSEKKSGLSVRCLRD